MGVEKKLNLLNKLGSDRLNMALSNKFLIGAFT